MSEHLASCRCGQFQARCEGEPVRVSVCHCLNCQKRSGSAFAAQARWPEAQVALTGTFKTWEAVSDNGKRGIFRFCPECGSTLAYTIEALPGLIAIAVGAFADPTFPPPQYSVYEERKHVWVAIIGGDIEHFD